jgi:hypothetical protein
MRRFLTFTLTLVAGLLVLGVPAAVAGGPTSVLLANYETGRSAAALNGSAAYTELQSILGAESTPVASSTPPAVVKESDPQVRLVWLIHDVSPWRIDNVHVVGADVWVESWLDTAGTDPYAGSPTWHRSARGDDLVTSLTTLGVLGSAGPDAGGSTSARQAVAPSPATDTVPEPSTSGVPWPLATGLTAVGVLLGTVLGTLLAGRGRGLFPFSRRIEALG